MNLKTKAWLGLIIASAVIALALFISAGTLSYWQAWVYLGIAAVTGVLLTLYTISDPTLLESRTKFGPAAETRPVQKLIVACLLFPMVAAFIVPGLDHRFGWSNVPAWLCIIGDLLVLLSMWMVYRVYKENSFGSATVGISKGQHVITTGPYAIVRNPMYSSAVVYLIGLSLALGSYWALIASVLAIAGLVWRLFDEERFLVETLPGYTEYCAKVRWHLIPRIL